MSNTLIPNVTRRYIEDDAGNRRDYYLGTVSSDFAKVLTFVPVAENSTRTFLEEDVTDGYQRPGSATRMGHFADYAEAHPLSVVPPVVLSGRNQWTFQSEKNSDFGSLVVSGPAAIIDGQHRMGGYVKLWEKSKSKRMVDFVLLPDLDHDQEVAEFLAINNTQKGVDKSLTTLLKGSDESLVGVELDTRDDSPFRGKITQVKRQPAHLFTLSAMAKNIARTFSHGAFAATEVDTKVDIMIAYWDAIADTFPEEWADIDKASRDREFKLLETTGLIAWSWASDDILGPSFDPHSQAMNWDAVKAKLLNISESGEVDWLKEGDFANATGEVGGRLIHKQIQHAMSSASQ